MARSRSSRALAASLFMSSAAVLCLLTLLMPGMIRTGGGWKLAFAGLTLTLGLGALIVLVLRRVSDLAMLLDVLAIDLIIVLGHACLQERSAGRLVAILFALPSLYLALYGRTWTIFPQGLAVVLGSSVIMTLGSDDGEGWLFGAMATFTVLVSVIGPTAAILVLRHRLIHALRHARALSTTDPLTGLLNRRGINERSADVVATARAHEVSLGVVVADVDHFKRINDRYGHAIGDQVLRLVADATSSCAAPGDLVVRLGGEELAVVTARDPEALIDLAERIRRQVAAATHTWPVTVSLGVAWAETDELDGDPVRLAWNLADEADDLMYTAKRGGRNRVALPVA